MIKRSRTLRQLRLAAVVVVSIVSLAGCGKGASGNTPDKEAQAKMLIAPEDLLTISSNALTSGPSITGSIEPERRADLRAEVSAVVLAVLKENGDPVKRGDLLVRLDQTSIRDSLKSAEASARAAEQAYEQAERQFQRMTTLRETGVVSTQQLEDVEIRRNTAQSEREAARSRVVTARQQLAAHRSARAVRRHRERPQGVGGRHRRGRQGAGQGHRPVQPALRRPRVRGQRRRSARPASTSGSGSTASRPRTSPAS